MAFSKLDNSADLPARRKKPPLVRLLFWLLILAALCAYYPPFFRFGVRQFASYMAQRSGLRLEIARVDGSLLEPVSFTNATLSSASFAGSEIHLRIAKAEATFSFKNALFHHGTGWIKKLVIDGMDGEVILPRETSGGENPESSMPIPLSFLPASIQARKVNLALHDKDALIFLQNIECNASDVDAGTISIEKIHIAESWLTKTFTNVRGTMALQNSKISVASVALEEGMRLENASADILELMDRKLKMDFQLSAFNGDIKGDIQGFTRENQHLNFEATGSFSRISIPALAAFLDSPEAAGGTIQDGQFSFYGSLRDLAGARFSTRLAAQDFRWGKRQWNSLVLGAMMVDRHLQIHNFELRQAHNTLNLSGDIAMPDSPSGWLQTDFNFEIDAKIDNVTELSLLFGSEFSDMAGTAVINGSIRGQAKSFTGDLTVSGSNLTYRTLPVDTLQASVKLTGDEVQVPSFEIVRKNDFLRGKGGANFSSEKRYWGEVSASVADLSLYSAFLQPPVVPQSFGGGLVLDWSGDGTAKTHSGAFHAQLKNIRPLVETDPKSVPINAEIEGTYSPESIFFKKFALSHLESSLSATISATPKSLDIEALELKHGNEVRLQGGALLPFNLWRAWRQIDGACWNPDGECRLDLTAKNLDLHDALLLTGREIPQKGEVQGRVTTSGTFADLNAAGWISFGKGEIEIEPDLVLFEGSATLDGKKIKLEKSLSRYKTTKFTAGGEIDLSNRLDPELKLSVRTKAFFQQGSDLHVIAGLDLYVDGAVSAARVTGTANILSADYAGKVDLYSLILLQRHLDFSLNPDLAITQDPFNHWQIDVACKSDAALKTGENMGVVWPDLHLRGSGETFSLTGSLTFENMTFRSPLATVTVDAATMFLQQDNPNSPVIDAIFSASTRQMEISGYLLGPLNETQLLLVSNPPVPELSIFQLLVHGFAARMQVAELPGFLDGMPFSLMLPYLDDSAKFGEYLILPSPDEAFNFADHGSTDQPDGTGSPESTGTTPAN